MSQVAPEHSLLCLVVTAEYLLGHTILRSETFDKDHLWRFCLSSDSQDGFPIRIKAVNIINEPRIFKGIFAIIKPFLKEKMAERVTIVLELFRSLLFGTKRSLDSWAWLSSTAWAPNKYCFYL